MTFIEWIGFFISFIAMILLFFRQKIERRRADKDPEYRNAMEKRRQLQMKEFLRALDVHDEEQDLPKELSEEDEEEGFVAASPQQVKPSPFTPAALARNPHRLVQDHFPYTSRKEREETHAWGNRVVSADMEEDVYQDPYAFNQKEQQPAVQKILKQLKSPKEMVILHEIIGPPKAFRE